MIDKSNGRHQVVDMITRITPNTALTSASYHVDAGQKIVSG